MCFQIDWASVVVGRKFIIFALFYIVLVQKFCTGSKKIEPKVKLNYNTYTWRGLQYFQNFMVFRKVKPLLLNQVDR